MIHQPSGGAGGQTADIAIAAREILRWRKTLNEALSRHTGKPAEQIEKDSDRDYYLSASEAKDYGIVDHVVASTREAQAVVQPVVAQPAGVLPAASPDVEGEPLQPRLAGI